MSDEELKLESLEDVFSNAEPKADAPKEEAKADNEGETASPETDEATPEPKQAKSEDKAKEPESDSEKESDWTFKAVMDEREKRQRYERELEEARQKLKALEESKKKPERPDIFEDQDGAFNYVEQRISEAEMNTRFNLSREMMAMVKDDYEQREQEFLQLAQASPELAAQLRNHPNPAKFAYEKAVQASKLKEMENIDDYKAKVRAEIEQEIRAEMEASAKDAEAKAEQKVKSIAPSLTSSRSAGTKDEIRLESVQEILNR